MIINWVELNCLLLLGYNREQWPSLSGTMVASRMSMWIRPCSSMVICVLVASKIKLKDLCICVLTPAFGLWMKQKAMTQFEWHDGSIKNVHVDQTLLYDYQKQLGGHGQAVWETHRLAFQGQQKAVWNHHRKEVSGDCWLVGGLKGDKSSWTLFLIVWNHPRKEVSGTVGH